MSISCFDHRFHDIRPHPLAVTVCFTDLRLSSPPLHSILLYTPSQSRATWMLCCHYTPPPSSIPSQEPKPVPFSLVLFEGIVHITSPTGHCRTTLSSSSTPFANAAIKCPTNPLWCHTCVCPRARPSFIVHHLCGFRLHQPTYYSTTSHLRLPLRPSRS